MKKYIKVIEYSKDGLLPFGKCGVVDMYFTWMLLIGVVFTFPILYFFIQRNVYYKELK